MRWGTLCCNYTPDFPSGAKGVRLCFGSSYNYISSGNTTTTTTNKNNNNSLVPVATRLGPFKG